MFTEWVKRSRSDLAVNVLANLWAGAYGYLLAVGTGAITPDRKLVFAAIAATIPALEFFRVSHVAMIEKSREKGVPILGRHPERDLKIMTALMILFLGIVAVCGLTLDKAAGPALAQVTLLLGALALFVPMANRANFWVWTTPRLGGPPARPED